MTFLSANNPPGVCALRPKLIMRSKLFLKIGSNPTIKCRRIYYKASPPQKKYFKKITRYTYFILEIYTEL